MEKVPITKAGFEKLKKDLETFEKRVYSRKSFAILKLRVRTAISPKTPNIPPPRKDNLFSTGNAGIGKSAGHVQHH